MLRYDHKKNLAIQVRVLSPGHCPHQTHCIPCINFNFRPPYMSYTICHRQFPLKLAYVTTFNSCQGLTFDKVVIDGHCDVFAHGQLYTALSCWKSGVRGGHACGDSQNTWTIHVNTMRDRNSNISHVHSHHDAIGYIPDDHLDLANVVLPSLLLSS